MKKLLSLTLALLMVFSLATVALADEVDTTVETGTSTATVTVNYLSEGAGTSPEETLTFSIECTSVEDAADDITTASFTARVSDVTFAEGAAGSTSNTADLTINLPSYTSVGVYTYTITPSAGTTAGVTYYTDEITLVVTVTREDGVLKTTSTVHVETPPATSAADKVDEFDITYKTGNLEITKTVTGNLGDTSKYFEITVTLSGEDDMDYAKSYVVSGGKYTDETISIGVEKTLEIKHGDTITIKDLPYGVTYSVVETDYTASDGYEQAKYAYSDTSKVIDSEKDTVEITNTKDQAVDTGITLDSVPFILILSLCAAAVVLFVIKRRNTVEF